MDSNKKIIAKLESLANPVNIQGMARFGIKTKKAFGIPMPTLRKIAREIGKNHPLAQRLWASGFHEARTLASMIDLPDKVTEKQMEKWATDFYSWDVCDSVCSNLFGKTKFAWQKAVEWSRKEEEFIKRAGFVLMANLAIHDKKAKDRKFWGFFPLIKKESTDKRNFVKKAVNWALRQIGKRNSALNQKAIRLAKEIKRIDSPAARWVAGNALQELENKSIQARLIKQKNHSA